MRANEGTAPKARQPMREGGSRLPKALYGTIYNLRSTSKKTPKQRGVGGGYSMDKPHLAESVIQ